MNLGLAVSVIAGVMVTGFAAFWRGPREHRAMADAVADLEHHASVQEMELRARSTSSPPSARSG